VAGSATPLLTTLVHTHAAGCSVGFDRFLRELIPG
jgi:hypothetical protein